MDSVKLMCYCYVLNILMHTSGNPCNILYNNSLLLRSDNPDTNGQTILFFFSQSNDPLLTCTACCMCIAFDLFIHSIFN